MKKETILRRRVWRSLEEREKLLSEYRRSGRTQREFCSERKLPLTTLTLWLGKERRKKASRFVRVNFTSAPVAAMIEVVLVNGRAVRADTNIDAEKLLLLVSTLERVC